MSTLLSPAADRRRDGRAQAVAAAIAWIDAQDADHAILVALSRFDIVNAAYGRTSGDALLSAAERRIVAAAATALTPCHVARLAGATFVVAGGGDAALATTRIGEALSRPFSIGDTVAAVGTRFGVAQREAGDDAATLVARATEALVAVQASDGATVRVAGPAGGAPIAALAIDLHHAIDRDEIAILFQPVVRIADNRITAVEGLARWEHPTLGALGAASLFAAAERADLGLVLSDHIQRVALAQAAAWPDTLAHLHLSINITAADIARAGFAEAFLRRVRDSGFPCERLAIEITETALITDLAAAAEALEVLRTAGIRIAIDDFGTGYASFAYLKALPLDRLKIDRSLIHDIEESPRSRAVVRGIIAMAHALDLSVIAEGVETPGQRAILAEEGGSHYQGFLCAGAMDVPALARLVECRA